MSDRPTIHIEGDVSGQVASGEFVYQAQSIGGVINQLKIEGPVIKLKPLPVDDRPAAPKSFKGRQAEVQWVLDRLTDGPVQVFGEAGIGKSFLLRHLAHSQAAETARDGAVYVEGLGRPLEDVLQALFESFYESALPQLGLKPTPTQIRNAMAEIRASVVLDDFAGDRTQLEQVLRVAHGCIVLVAGEEETLLSEGAARPLGGLAVADASELFSNAAGRSFNEEENAAILAFCRAVEGHPASIVRTARRLGRGEMGFDDLNNIIAGMDTHAPMSNLAGVGLGLTERRLLAVLAAVAPAVLPVSAVAAVAEEPDAGRMLANLAERGLVQAASPRYRLSPDLVSLLELPDWREASLERLNSWVTDGAEASLVAEAGPAFDVLARWAAGRNLDAELVGLARNVTPALAVARRWGSLRSILEAAQSSARAAGDVAGQGWALHELGTLEVCSGEPAKGVEMLGRAEALRLAVGDTLGLEVTRHNLEQAFLLPGVTPPESPPEEVPPDEGPPEDGPPETSSPDPGMIEPEPEAAPPEPPPPEPPPPSPPTPRRPGWPRWIKLLIPIVLIAVIAVVIMNIRPPDDDDGGTPGEAFLSVDGAPIDFGTRPVGSEDDLNRRVANGGDVPIEYVDVYLEQGEFFGSETDCGFLDAGDSCQFVVWFFPPEPGEYQDVLVVDSDAANTPLYVEVRGRAADDGDQSSGLPDLAAQIVGISDGRIWVTNEGSPFYSAQVSIEVENLGGPFSEEYKVQFEWFNDAAGEWQSVPTASTATGFDPFFVGPVGAGGSTVFRGWAVWVLEWLGNQRQVSIRALVDSCFGDEFMAEFCRVEESDEGNNVSQTVDAIIER
ncbi:MAG: hypothetical protein OEM84_05850 [Acidimicrobiia bacterium]|nr:hypothetical protein [Acidimicrobiia bacterium]